MESLVSSGLDIFAKTPAAFIVYIVIAGCVLILFNVITAAIVQEGYGVRSLILNLKFKIKDLTPKMHLRGDDLV